MCYRSAQPSGSPPQVRGKLIGNMNTLKQQRITPAGAGKTRNLLPKFFVH